MGPLGLISKECDRGGNAHTYLTLKTYQELLIDQCVIKNPVGFNIHLYVIKAGLTTQTQIMFKQEDTGILTTLNGSLIMKLLVDI